MRRWVRAECRYITCGTDALTGLGNRRALVDDLERAVDGCGLHLALFDLDGFKRYNDELGHVAGDELLRRLGERLELAVRGCGGTADRVGGDEFCVLFEGDGGRGGVPAARAALTDLDAEPPVRASSGVAPVRGGADVVVETLRAADQLMYADKLARRAQPGRRSASHAATGSSAAASTRLTASPRAASRGEQP